MTYKLHFRVGCIAIALMSVALNANAQGKAPAGEASSGTAKTASKLDEKATADAAKPVSVAENVPVGYCRCVGDGDSAAVEKIEKALRSPLAKSGLDFVDTPLNDVVSQLQDDYGIQIQLDKNALQEIGVTADEHVTVNIHNVSLRSALRLMLKQLQMTYIIEDEVLIITTPDAAEAQLKTCVYDVRSLTDDNSDKSVEALVDTITSCIATDTWATNGGGQAEIRQATPGLLVITQTRAVHEEIHSLLDIIRQMRKTTKK